MEISALFFPKFSMLSLLLPIGYLGLIALIYKLFTTFNLPQKSKSYFAENVARLEYLELAEQYTLNVTGLKILETALLKRAAEDLRRLMLLRDQKPSVSNLVAQGIMGQDMLDKITVAEMELNNELEDLMAESKIYRPDWEQTILQEASALLQQLASNDLDDENNDEIQQQHIDNEAIESPVEQPAQSPNQMTNEAQSPVDRSAQISNAESAVEEPTQSLVHEHNAAKPIEPTKDVDNEETAQEQRRASIIEELLKEEPTQDAEKENKKSKKKKNNKKKR
jgi:translocation protein SEC66